MLIQHDKATTAAFRPGQAFSGNRKSIVTNGDASKGLTGWTIISGDASVVNGAFRVASTATEGGNMAQAFGRKLKPGKDYTLSVSQLGGVGNGQWIIESAPGAEDIYTSSGIDGTESHTFTHNGGDVIIRLKSIKVSGSEYCDFDNISCKVV